MDGATLCNKTTCPDSPESNSAEKDLGVPVDKWNTTKQHALAAMKTNHTEKGTKNMSREVILKILLYLTLVWNTVSSFVPPVQKKQWRI